MYTRSSSTSNERLQSITRPVCFCNVLQPVFLTVSFNLKNHHFSICNIERSSIVFKKIKYQFEELLPMQFHLSKLIKLFKCAFYSAKVFVIIALSATFAKVIPAATTIHKTRIIFVPSQTCRLYYMA